MTYSRPPRSVGARIHEALNALPPATLDAIGLTASTLYKISLPGSRIKLGLDEAALLDAGLQIDGKPPQFLPHFLEVRSLTLTALSIRYGRPTHSPADLRTRLTEAVSALGDLADEIHTAHAPAGESGASISSQEAADMLTEADRLSHILDQLRQDILALRPEAPGK